MKEEAFIRLLDDYRAIRHTGGQELLIALLRETQELFGCIPRDAQPRIAEAMATAPSAVSALVRRVPGLKDAPSRNVIIVCRGPRCTAKGSPALLEALKSELGICPGQTTHDGGFTIAQQYCFKQCGAAPNLTINGKLYSGVTADELPRLLEPYR